MSNFWDADPVASDNNNWWQQDPLHPESAPISATGLAKSAGTGLLEGAASVPGLMGDIGQLRGAADKAVFTPDQQAQIAASKSFVPNPVDVLPSTATLVSALSKLGLIHTPQNAAERSTENVSSFAGAGAIGGPTAALKALVPGAVSEAAGKLTEGTAAEPYARVAAALLTPGIGSRTPSVSGAAPATADLLASGEQGLNSVRATNSAVEPSVMAGWASRNISDLNARNIGQRADSVTNLLNDVAANRTPMSGQDLDLLKLKLRDIAGTGSVPERTAAQIALGNLDDRLNTLSNAQMRVGNPEDITGPWMQGKGDYAAGKRAETVDNLTQNGLTAAAAENSGMNSGNKVRQQFKPMLKANSPLARGFNPDEMAQATRVANGTVTGNIMRYGSNVLGGGGGVMQTMIPLALGGAVGAGQGSYGEGTAAALSAAALGMMLRKGANASVLRQANRLSEMVRARSPSAASAGVTVNLPTAQQSMLARLLMAHNAGTVPGFNK